MMSFLAFKLKTVLGGLDYEQERSFPFTRTSYANRNLGPISSNSELGIKGTQISFELADAAYFLKKIPR